ncbi:MAG: hypothetical protein HY660_08935 [Armatimonadetes bacterium]|nr:hypothetical protein [Armatimonadota bacterium]
MRPLVRWCGGAAIAVLAAVLMAGGGTAAPAAQDLVIDTGAAAVLNLDPVRWRSTLEKNVLSLIYERLTRYDNAMRLRPGLAESWRVEADRVTWTFTLRQGVKFHDGTPLTAAAVRASFERILDPRSVSLAGALYRESMETVTAVDDRTLRIKTRGPYAALPQLLAGWGGEIACPEAVRQGDAFNSRGCGSGPYRVESFAPRDRLALARVADYWGEKGVAPRLTVRVIPEDASRVAALTSGQTHVLLGLPPHQVDFLRQNPRFRIADNRSMYMDYLAFNLQAKPFDDRRVRLAVTHAINADDIVRRVYSSNIVPFGGPVHPSLVGYDPTVRPYPYNLAKARQLLQEAGQSGLRMTFSYTDTPTQVRMAEVIQAQLREAGIDVTLRKWEFAAYTPMLVRGDQQLFIWGFGNSAGDAFWTMYSLFRSTASRFLNVGRYRNPAVDETLDQIRGELDEKRRAALISKTSRIIAADASHVLFLAPKNNIAHLATVAGIEPYPVGDFTMFAKAHRQ